MGLLFSSSEIHIHHHTGEVWQQAGRQAGQLELGDESLGLQLEMTQIFKISWGNQVLKCPDIRNGDISCRPLNYTFSGWNRQKLLKDKLTWIIENDTNNVLAFKAPLILKWTNYILNEILFRIFCKTYYFVLNPECEILNLFTLCFLLSAS